MTHRILGSAALFFVLAATSAHAQSPASHYANRPVEINGHVGAMIFDDVISDGDTEVMGGARVAYNLASGLGIGGNFDIVAVEDADLYLYSGEVDYTFGSPNRAHFFVGAGLGQARFDIADDAFLNDDDESQSWFLIPLAVGLKWFNRTDDPNWAIRGELRDNIIAVDVEGPTPADDVDETTHNIELSGGLSLLLGGG